MAAPAYSNLTKSAGPNPGGTAQTIYWAPTSSFAAAGIQAPANWDVATTVADISEISTDHVFLTGKQLQKWYCTQNKGEANFTEASEIDANGGMMVGKLFLPGIDQSNFGNMVLLKSDDLIFIVPTADGKYLQFGTELFPAKIKNVKFGVAQMGSGIRGTEVEFEAFQLCPYVYTGTLQLTPAV